MIEMTTLQKVYNLVFPWLINNSLRVIKFRKRDEALWIFGAWGGDNYSDNSRYLFEYVTENHPEINAVWITSRHTVKEKLSAAGQTCFLYNEPEGRRARLNAKYGFYTNSIGDFGKYDLCHGMTKVALWHGMPLKKLYYATNNLQKRSHNLPRLLQYIVLKIYNKADRDYTIATSDLTKKLLIECFEVRPETVLVTGQPRNDGLFDEEGINKVKNILNYDPAKKFVLYMPTWRDLGGNDEYLDSILVQLTEDKSFLNKLEIENIHLYIKPHPRITVKTKSTSNITVLKGLSDIDTQNLLGAADVLITDYSSAFIDYALLERPIHFYVPDLENYKNDKMGVFFSFEELAECWFDRIDEFKNCVLDSIPYNQLGLKNSCKVNCLYNDSNLPKGKYTAQFFLNFKNVLNN